MLSLPMLWFRSTSQMALITNKWSIKFSFCWWSTYKSICLLSLTTVKKKERGFKCDFEKQSKILKNQDIMFLFFSFCSFVLVVKVVFFLKGVNKFLVRSVIFQRGKNQHVESSHHNSAGLGLHQQQQRGLQHTHNAHLWSQGSKTSVGPQSSFSSHHHCKLSIPITFSCI